MYLYAIRDNSTGKLINKITNPGHKFWEKEGSCKTALESYKRQYESYISSSSYRYKQDFKYNPSNLEVIKFELSEVPTDG